DRVDQWRLALQTANTGTSATLLRPFANVLSGMREVHLPDWATGRLTWIVAVHPGRVGGHPLDLFFNFVRRIAQKDRITGRFRHFSTIQPGQLWRVAQKRLWLREQQSAAALQIAKQSLL